jgi:hypothetical protein
MVTIACAPVDRSLRRELWHSRKMLRRPSSSRAGAAGLGLSLAALLTVAFASCSSSRLGAVGATCTKTDDCESPLHCIDSVCSDTSTTSAGGAGGGSSTTTTGGGTSSATTSTGSSSEWGACDTCLDTACAAEEAACDGECRAIEGCIETVCANLSLIGASDDEGQCQVKCQGDHPDGKQKHLALVNCADGAACSPPCTFYPQDYDLCRSVANKGACAAANQACKDSSECQTYKDCVTTCKTIAECIACDDSAAGLAGRKVLEAYEVCVAGDCTAAAWLP